MEFEYKNIAVLYRTNAQSRNMEEALLKANIPYKVIGSIYFYKRKEIKDLIAYLNIIYNSNDDVSLLRAINTPKRGIGAKTIENLISEATINGQSIFDTIKTGKEKAFKDAELLSKERERSCIGLTKDISKELEELGLRKNGFNARLTRVELNQEGIDNGLFFVSLNDGLEEESLKKAASGGETSRLLLALKSVLNNLNPYNCLIFDEIDTGVSGKQAGLVAKKISAISKISQTITISHRPQVVASQEQGILVYKQNENSTTKTHVRALSEEEMIQELAKMLSSSEVSETALAQARTLRAELRKA